MLKGFLIFTVIVGILFGGILFYVYISRDVFSPELPPMVTENYFKGNLHTHTLASDGQMTYSEAIDEAKKLGFNFIAITDHNTISPETAELCPVEKGILCIIGEEVSSTEGHILALGIKNVVPQNLTPEETIQNIHEQGGLVIPSHPEQDNGLSLERIKNLPFDAIECSIRHQKENGGYNCDDLPNYSYFWNSDAHQLSELGLISTKCLMVELTFQNLKTAIKEKMCSEVKGLTDLK